MYAVAVDAIRPTPTPVRKRPARSPARLGQITITTAATIPSSSAGKTTRRRPMWSDRCPSVGNVAAVPATIAANATVVLMGPKWSRSW